MRGFPGNVDHRPAQCGSVPTIAAAVLACAVYAGATTIPSPAGAQTLQPDGSVSMSGRSVRCGSVRTVMDPNLPSEGAAAPGRVLVLNPRLLRQHTDTVRLFVFHHECGHHQVGASELRADCWGVEQGVRQGWLERRGLREICESFEGAPETATHPSGRRRCQNLERCYAAATEAQQPGSGATTASTSTGPTNTASFATGSTARRSSSPAPKLVRGPTLVSIGTLRPRTATNGWSARKCDESAKTASVADFFGRLIERFSASEPSESCH